MYIEDFTQLFWHFFNPTELDGERVGLGLCPRCSVVFYVMERKHLTFDIQTDCPRCSFFFSCITNVRGMSLVFTFLVTVEQRQMNEYIIIS